jgi:hypothetical protein
MATKTYTSVAAVRRAWVRLGCAAAGGGGGAGAGGEGGVDLEALLVATGDLAAGDPGVLRSVGAWLARYGGAVARHRLVAKLMAAPTSRRGIGVMVSHALAGGAMGELVLVQRACGDEVELDGEVDVSGLAAHDVVMRANVFLRERLMRKGDLRCSIVEVLRHDVKGSVHAAAELARLTSTTRAAVNKALRALYLEGDVVIRVRPGSRRDYEVSLAR